MSIVGLPDAAVKESSDRVSAAIRNSQLSLPVRKITINLAPAESVKKALLSTCLSLWAFLSPAD
jgi:magnesium chelatase family protein